MVLVLTKSLRLKLKYPIGFLIEGDVKSVMNRLLPMIQDLSLIHISEPTRPY